MTKFYDKHEQQTARAFSGKLVRGSGRVKGNKGDVDADFLRVECKATEKVSYILKRTVWDKIHQEALQHNKRPILALELQGERLVVMSENFFLEMLEAYRESQTISEEAVSAESVHFDFGGHTLCGLPCGKGKDINGSKEPKKVSCPACRAAMATLIRE